MNYIILFWNVKFEDVQLYWKRAILNRNTGSTYLERKYHSKNVLVLGGHLWTMENNFTRKQWVKGLQSKLCFKFSKFLDKSREKKSKTEYSCNHSRDRSATTQLKRLLATSACMKAEIVWISENHGKGSQQLIGTVDGRFKSQTRHTFIITIIREALGDNVLARRRPILWQISLKSVYLLSLDNRS